MLHILFKGGALLRCVRLIVQPDHQLIVRQSSGVKIVLVGCGREVEVATLRHKVIERNRLMRKVDMVMFDCV